MSFSTSISSFDFRCILYSILAHYLVRKLNIVQYFGSQKELNASAVLNYYLIQIKFQAISPPKH